MGKFEQLTGKWYRYKTDLTKEKIYFGLSKNGDVEFDISSGENTAVIDKKDVEQFIDILNKLINSNTLNNIKWTLKNVIDIQCSPGNYDHNPYNHGMANGLILAMSIIEGKTPEYIQTPKHWLKDIKIDKTQDTKESLEQSRKEIDKNKETN